ncbi:uncharacterized protein EV154DRAFT_540283 [Mucor mucedo]|uniref:Uncharacterized protein n=1 Tax=Mucor saturninus TaxID=64648 RepID=A0A8H7QVV0_9FUNG|nr:uncharacterized protein EV154DRAFT_540283 [Mucor mucedo]KAG2198526.1 hypothetical protein INT47_008630 [Mucor saturninus]KAI7876808.1 hypothetical protein EV154DRAFT_540283 [Mucor mucedo]
MSTSFRLPYGYRAAPEWPSLYWPFGPGFDPLNLIADIPHSLYYLSGIWAFVMLAKSRTLKWYILITIPFIFVLGGSVASFVIGSIMGVALAFVYNAGFFVMSTWIPFLWALIHILIVLVGSYSTITAIL